VAVQLYRKPEGEQAIRSWSTARLDAWTVPHERRIVSSALGQTSLVTAGDGPATVLYLPGTNFNAASSLPLAGALAARLRVVVADLPGQPGLSAGRRPPGLRAYGAWIDEIVAGLDVRRVLLAGHSLGAAAALTADPAGVHGLLLLDPAGLIRLRVGLGTLGATLPWLMRPTPARSARLLALMHARGRAPSPEHVEWMTLVARHVRTSLAPPPLPPEVLDRWRDTPRAVLCGDQDCFLPVPRLADAVRRKLGVDLDVVAEAGHLTPEDQPERVAEAISALG
jgi:pimeloyl-ACP methyl ester carboxylesterase